MMRPLELLLRLLCLLGSPCAAQRLAMIGAEEGAGSTAGGGSSRHRLVGGGGGVASGSRTSSSWRSLLDSSFSSNGTGYYLPNGTSTSNASAHAVQQISPGTTASGGRPLRFGIVNTGSPALAAVQQGWNQSCRDAGVVCYYAVSDGETCLEPRLSILREYVGMQLDGIAAKPCDDDAVRQLFEEASALGIPVVTFDSDVENSTREAYVGTDNHFVGATLARQLRQLRPEGGSYCLVGSKEERVAGFREVISKYNNRAGSIGKWSEVAQNESAMDWEKAANWTALLEHCARRNPTAIVMVYQSPMRDAAAWEAFARANRWRNITTIGVDASDYQLDYLNRRLVDGLVGQLPYEIGELALQLLLERAVTGRNLTRDFYPTNLVSYNVIPIELPPLTVNQNLLGSVDALGYACFALVVVASAACAGWTYRCRRAVVVQAAQPAFLHMVAGGTVVLASALVPLGMDVGEDRYDEAPLSYRVGICMSVPWLAFTGFTVVFSALFSKTWRVARLFLRSGDNAASPFARNTVAVHHVLAPAAVLMTGNFVVLVCWTVLDPLTYVRVVNDGVDYWNRVISTYGACRSEQTLAFLLPLALINFAGVAIAAWQAYRTRDIEDEFSEAKYIGLAICTMLQAFLTGIPVIAVVKDMPQAYYIVLTMIIFILCLSWLLLIFLPKMLLHRSYSKLSEREQKKKLLQKVKDSAGTSQLSFDAPSQEMRGSGNTGGSNSRRGSASDRFQERRASASQREPAAMASAAAAAAAALGSHEDAGAGTRAETPGARASSAPANGIEPPIALSGEQLPAPDGSHPSFHEEDTKFEEA